MLSHRHDHVRRIATAAPLADAIRYGKPVPAAQVHAPRETVNGRGILKGVLACPYVGPDGPVSFEEWAANWRTDRRYRIEWRFERNP